MARPSSVLCPSCGTLVGVNDKQCLSCGRLYPGMWGFAHLLRHVGDDMGFATLVMWVCGALYLACLAVDPEGIQGSGLTLVPVAQQRRASSCSGRAGRCPCSASGAGGRC